MACYYLLYDILSFKHTMFYLLIFLLMDISVLADILLLLVQTMNILTYIYPLVNMCENFSRVYI